MRRALINVDYTYDFVAEDGKLTCGVPGQAIEGKIVSLTKEFIEAGDFVTFGIDAHEEGDKLHPESALFPAHNIVGTRGMELYGTLNELYEKHKDDENVFYFEKTRYSAFAGTNLELKLRERNIKEVHLVGVCTDICILHTAVDAYNKGFHIVVHKDGVASFNQIGHEWALEHFKNTLGAEVV
ncbi:cysteine hydrolase family protein [Pseudogracilibacillus auburnensis]|uniref:Nicotinamidase-related amidase n=1 Tax=Pseudogracilibacillus auburnensis TaxID=1494959 RepID=A0A2V3VW69_9BACI|nr:cysteine hydrolase family protein [Pseudogracilibacillus auburnensis]MBO1002377.1 cysteine hydrolase family protein [Pseudogracilibacillus auburnensis]PXW86233.1 nicotinamidase-related amidase [Pseudogracilibacillus auburnensis]